MSEAAETSGKAPSIAERIGQTLKRIRKERGLTQEDIATAMSLIEGAEVRQSYISKVETGDFPPSIERIDSLAQAMGISVELLLFETIFDGTDAILTEKQKPVFRATRRLINECFLGGSVTQ